MIEHGAIPDPYYGTNEPDTLWVSRTDWILARSFQVEPDFLAGRRVLLSIESLDTWAEVRINGHRAGESCNMFRPLRLEIGELLEPGENSIELYIYSAEKKAEELSRRRPYPVPYTEHPVQSLHRNLVRKVQCHSGWEWGPCLMVSGVYGEILITSYEWGKIEYVTIDTRQRRTHWEVEVSIEYYAYLEGEVPVEISLAGQRRSGPRVTARRGYIR